MGKRGALFLIVCMWLAACTTPKANLPHGQSAYQVIPLPAAAGTPQDYRIGPLDMIDIRIYQEPDLSAEKVVVDASGNITVPLVGMVTARGKTSSELARELEKRLGEKYLKNPQVTVIVEASISQKVVVQGEVTEPGVYDLKGPTTLLEAISMAKGETRIAALQEVAVFRTIDGKRMGAVFDVEAIRRGEANDPAVMGNDVVVVGFSRAKSTWRDILTAAPLLNVFRPLAY